MKIIRSEKWNKLSNVNLKKGRKYRDQRWNITLPARPIFSPNFGLVGRKRFELITVKGVTSINLQRKHERPCFELNVNILIHPNVINQKNIRTDPYERSERKAQSWVHQESKNHYVRQRFVSI